MGIFTIWWGKASLAIGWDRCSQRSCLHHPPCSVLSALGCARDFTHLININEFGDTFLCRMAVADWSWCVEKPHSWAAAAAAPMANKHRSLPRGDVVCNSGISLRTKFLGMSNWIVGSCFSTVGWCCQPGKDGWQKSRWMHRCGAGSVFVGRMVGISFNGIVEPKSGTI